MWEVHTTGMAPKKNRDEEFKDKPKKGLRIKIPKLYEFQFFDDFEELQ